MSERDSISEGSGRDGFIIIAVLWMLIGLATLASIYSVYIANTATALAVTDEALQAELLTTTSLELTAYAFSSTGQDAKNAADPRSAKDAKNDKAARLSRGAFRFRAGAANVGVSFVSEAARIDLNAAPKEMLAGLFAAIGVKSDAAMSYADRVIGWRTPPKEGYSTTDEDAFYRSAGLNYSPRGAPFTHVDELWLVYGLPPALIERVMPYVTVYSGLDKINVRDAAPQVIAALPNMTPALLNSFLDMREAGPIEEQSLKTVLGSSESGATTEASETYRVQIRVAFDNGRLVESEAVILTGTDDSPYHVLYWRDDASNGPGQLRTGARLR
jgi:general secretion pathway protein K